MLQNAYFFAKIGADTAENEQHFAEICQKLGTTKPAARRRRGAPVAPGTRPGPEVVVRVLLRLRHARVILKLCLF